MRPVFTCLQMDQGSTLQGGWAGLQVGDPTEIVAPSCAVALGGDAGVSGWVQSSSWLCCDPSGASWREQSQLLPNRAGWLQTFCVKSVFEPISPGLSQASWPFLLLAKVVPARGV